MSLLAGDGNPEALEAALCAVYAPRDPIAEYWQGAISLRALRALIVHMPQQNAFHETLGDGWNEINLQLWDIGQTIRDFGMGLINAQPFLKRRLTARDIRPAILPPAQRVRQQRAGARRTRANQRERAELMATATGTT